MNRKLIIPGIAAAILIVSTTLAADRPTQPFMRQKSAYAQGLLEGITLEKFDLVLTNALKLRDMSATNAFLILRNPDYLTRITNFQVSVDALIANAKQQNQTATFEAYVKVAENCMDCHRYFRREQFRIHNAPPSGK